MDSKFSIESFIDFCNDMMICEEQFNPLSNTKLLPAIVNDNENKCAVYTFLDKVSTYVGNDPDKIHKICSLILSDPDSMTHIINNHTEYNEVYGKIEYDPDKLDRQIKWKESDELSFFELIIDKLKNNTIKNTVEKFLHKIIRERAYEIQNFKYTTNSRFYNYKMNRYEYTIDHEFDDYVGYVYNKIKDEYTDTKIIRLILSKESKYGDIKVVSMYPILKEKMIKMKG